MSFLDFFKNILKKENIAEIDYNALSQDELLALTDENLLEAVNSILYYDFDENDIDNINPQQKTVLTILSFDCEVQGGGLCSFFVNSSSAFAPFVTESLKNIGALKLERLYHNFIAQNHIDVNDLSSFKTDDIDDYEKQTERFDFDAFDDAFYKIYENENLTDLILPYIKENIAEIFSDRK